MYHQFTDLPTYKNHLFVLSPPTLHSLTPSHSDSPLIPSPVSLIPSPLTTQTLIPSSLIQHTPIPNPLTPHTLTHPVSPSHLPHPFTLHSFSLILFSATKTSIKKNNPEYSYNTLVCNTESDTYHSQPAPSKESPYMCNTYYSHQHATPTSIGT